MAGRTGVGPSEQGVGKLDRHLVARRVDDLDASHLAARAQRFDERRLLGAQLDKRRTGRPVDSGEPGPNGGRYAGDVARPCLGGKGRRVADITAQTAFDFFGKIMKTLPGDDLPNLARWYADVSARPSAKAGY